MSVIHKKYIVKLVTFVCFLFEFLPCVGYCEAETGACLPHHKVFVRKLAVYVFTRTRKRNTKHGAELRELRKFGYISIQHRPKNNCRLFIYLRNIAKRCKLRSYNTSSLKIIICEGLISILTS